MAHERRCIVDATEYKYCNQCSAYNPEETWRFLFCSENCREIYSIITKCLAGSITADEARKRLDECDMSGVDHFQPVTKKDLDKILAATTPVVEDTTTEALTTKEETIESVVKIKPRSIRKQKKIEKIDE